MDGWDCWKWHLWKLPRTSFHSLLLKFLLCDPHNPYNPRWIGAGPGTACRVELTNIWGCRDAVWWFLNDFKIVNSSRGGVRAASRSCRVWREKDGAGLGRAGCVYGVCGASHGSVSWLLWSLRYFFPSTHSAAGISPWNLCLQSLNPNPGCGGWCWGSCVAQWRSEEMLKKLRDEFGSVLSLLKQGLQP